MNLRQLFVLGAFEARQVTLPFWLLERVFALAMVVAWFGGAALLFDLLKGHVLPAAPLFLVWLIAIVLAACWLHRSGRVRAVFSLGATAVVLFVTVYVWYATRS